MNEDGDLHDDDPRLLERAWRVDGDAEAGERWVRSVLAATGAPILPMISMMISHHRALRAIGEAAGVRSYDVGSQVIAAFRQPVMPDDIVDFLRRQGEFAAAVTR